MKICYVNNDNNNNSPIQDNYVHPDDHTSHVLNLLNPTYGKCYVALHYVNNYRYISTFPCVVYFAIISCRFMLSPVVLKPSVRQHPCTMQRHVGWLVADMDIYCIVVCLRCTR